LTTSNRFAISGVSAEAMPMPPTAAAAHASSDSARGFRGLTRAGYNVPVETDLRLPRWAIAALALAAVGLVPWTLWLTISLPSRHVSDNYDVAWVGFDIALATAFALTVWTALRHAYWIVPAAAVTGTMLLCDAWFDIVTSHTSGERVEAVLEAIFAELPLAVVCALLVVDAERFLRRLRLRR
jgi:hypothetical protein